MRIILSFALLAACSPVSAASLKGGVKKAVFCGVYGPAAFHVGNDKDKKELGIDSKAVLDKAQAEFVAQAEAAGYSFVDPAPVVAMLKAAGKAKAAEGAANLRAGAAQGAAASAGGANAANRAAIEAIRNNPQIPEATRKQLLAQYGALEPAKAAAPAGGGGPDFSAAGDLLGSRNTGPVSAATKEVARYCPTAAPNGENAAWIAALKKAGADGWLVVKADIESTGTTALAEVNINFAPDVFSVGDEKVLDGSAKGRWGLRKVNVGGTVGSARKVIAEKVPEAVGKAIEGLVK